MKNQAIEASWNTCLRICLGLGAGELALLAGVVKNEQTVAG